MTFVVINRKPAYISLDKYSQMRNEYFDNIEAWGTLNIDLNEAIKLILKKSYKHSPGFFLDEYFWFDFRGEEARNNAWTILHDYSRYKAYCLLLDIRTDDERLRDEPQYPCYPMGKTFEIMHYDTRHFLWLFFGEIINILISVNDITRITGPLDKIKIFTTDMTIQLGKNLHIVPLSKEGRHKIKIRGSTAKLNEIP